MTMMEMKRAIVKSFRKQYGFGPSMNSIIPMESSGYSNQLDWMAFCIGEIGYTYEVNKEVERNESYDL